jgi:DNA-binding transcriptional MocR family regulator
MKQVAEPFGPLPESIMFCRHISPTDKLVWAYLRRRESRTRPAYPSTRTMSKDLHLNRRTVQRALESLTSFGLVNMQRGGGHQTTKYCTHTPAESDGWKCRKCPEPCPAMVQVRQRQEKTRR